MRTIQVNSRRSWLAGTTLAMLAAAPLFAGAFFEEELGNDPAKIADRVKIDLMNGGKGSDSGRGQAPYMKALGAPPKRVALVSFYVRDSGNSEKHPYMGWSSAKNVKANAVDTYANEFYDASIAGMKASFKAHGMDLLAPDQFLDTPDKKQAYEAFEVKAGATARFVTWISKKGDKDSTRLEGVPEGYRLLALPSENDTKSNHFGLLAKGGDGKLFESVGHDLATGLGVDAVAFLYAIVQAQSKSIDMLGAYMYVFGPNPVKRDDDPSLYWNGHQYSGAKMKFEVSFVKTDRKGVANDADFAGFAPVAKALSDAIGDDLVARTSGKD
ncbi:MAG: hypothetical protein HY049_15835 [Acidobacteria bacterium]|nr:hypothetical protein [Acidobacteriota bacterium]